MNSIPHLYVIYTDIIFFPQRFCGHTQSQNISGLVFSYDLQNTLLYNITLIYDTDNHNLPPMSLFVYCRVA